MGVDSQAVGGASAPHSIEHDGQTYEFRLVDQLAKATWEKRLYKRAVAAAEALADAKPDGWLEDKLVKLDEAFLAGDFSFFSELSKNLLGKPGGAALLLSILTGRELLDLAPLLQAKGKQVKALIHLVLRESFPSLKIEMAEEEAEPKN